MSDVIHRFSFADVPARGQWVPAPTRRSARRIRAWSVWWTTVWRTTSKATSPTASRFSCTCSRERAGRMLRALPREEIFELLDSRGTVDVTGEVCGARYEYDRIDTHLVYDPQSHLH